MKSMIKIPKIWWIQMKMIYIFNVCDKQVTDSHQYVMTVSQIEMKMLEIEGLYICKDISTSG